MPELIVLVVLIVVIGVVAVRLTGALRGGTAPAALPSERARWRAGHRTEGDATIVHVVLTEPEDRAPALERRDVGRIPNDAPDYDARLQDLMQVARERAVLLDLNRA